MREESGVDILRSFADAMDDMSHEAELAGEQLVDECVIEEFYGINRGG